MTKKAERAEVERDQPRREPEAPPKREERSEEPATLAAAAPDADALAAVMRTADSGSKALAASALQRRLGNAQLQRLAKAPRVQIQRFEGWEHAYLGDKDDTGKRIVLESHKKDLPDHDKASPTAEEAPESWSPTWKGIWKKATPEQKRAIVEGLSYGDVTALSGDFYRSWEELNNAPLVEIINLVGLARNKEATTEEFQAATGGRFMELAEHNISHFSPETTGDALNNRQTWKKMHADAINAARGGNADAARGMSAAADHFLTDAFSGGHIRVKRQELLDSVGGQPRSRFEHNKDNKYGVRVKNAKGQRWIAYGDTHLGEEGGESDPDAQNLQIALEAVRLSKADVENAKGRATEATPDEHYAAEDLIPQVDDDPGLLAAVGDALVEPFQDVATAGGLVGEGKEYLSYADDTQIRTYVQGLQGDPLALGRVPVDDKIRMVKRLLSGWISDEDVDAATSILFVPASQVDRIRMRIELADDVKGMWSSAQQTALKIALASTLAPPEERKKEEPKAAPKPDVKPEQKADSEGGQEGPEPNLVPAYRRNRSRLKSEILAALRSAGSTTWEPSDADVERGTGPPESMWWDCLLGSGEETTFDPVAKVYVDPKADRVDAAGAEQEIAEFENLPADKKCPYFESLARRERSRAATSQ